MGTTFAYGQTEKGNATIIFGGFVYIHKSDNKGDCFETYHSKIYAAA
jgi:hypothetical protein